MSDVLYNRTRLKKWAADNAEMLIFLAVMFVITWSILFATKGIPKWF